MPPDYHGTPERLAEPPRLPSVETYLLLLSLFRRELNGILGVFLILGIPTNGCVNRVPPPVNHPIWTLYSPE